MVVKIAVTLLALVAWFGFIGPFCVSARATELVVGWYLATAVGTTLTVRWAVKKLKEKMDDGQGD